MAARFDKFLGRVRDWASKASDISDSGAAGRDILRMDTLAEIQSSVSGYAELLAAFLTRPMLVSAFGDSIMHLDGALWERVCSLSGGMLYTDGTTDFAQDGANSSAVLAQIQARPVGGIGSVAFVMAGSNDAAGNESPATRAGRIRQCIAAIKLRGALPVLIVSPPRTDSPAAQALIPQYRVTDFVIGGIEGIPVVDPWTDFVSEAGGGWTPDYGGDDNVHPGFVAHYRAAQRLWEQIRIGGKRAVLSPLFAGDGGLGTNPLLAGGVGSIAGCAVYGSNYTTSVGAAERGQYLRIQGLGAGCDGAVQFDYTTGFSQGDRIAFTAKIAASGIVGDSVFVTAQWLPDYAGLSTPCRFDKMPDGDYQIYAEFIIPPGATQLQALFRLASTNETGRIDISQVQMYRLPTL